MIPTLSSVEAKEVVITTIAGATSENDKVGITIILGFHRIFLTSNPVPYSISMGWCKKDVTPLLTHWSYVFLALTHRYAVHVPCILGIYSMPMASLIYYLHLTSQPTLNAGSPKHTTSTLGLWVIKEVICALSWNDISVIWGKPTGTSVNLGSQYFF